MKTDCIVSALFAHAEKTPGKVAFLDTAAGTGVTYAELKNTALQYAAAVLDVPNPERAPVAILADRSAASVCAMFGVILSGGWYVPVDAELPPERRALLLSVCAPALIVDVTGVGVMDNSVPVLTPKDLPALPGTLPLPERNPDAPLFGIYTSGSTGLPKLVVKSARAMESFTSVYCSAFGFTADDIFGNQIPFYFDASTKDIFSTVFLGASCVIIPAKEFSFPVNLVKTLNDYKITRIVWVPSALGIAAKFRVFTQAKPQYLKTVLFVGERMPVKYLNEWMDNLPDTQFVNLYGSTEVAGNSCYYIIDRRFDGADVLPIGKPFPGTDVFILYPETGAPADKGEIVVAGPGLAIGYYNHPEKTAEVFRNIRLPGFEGRAYFSGDIGRMNEYGQFVCLSRSDSQIKHMGHRIELGEIESIASAVDFVTEACCQYDAENEKIVLFYSADEDRTADLRHILAEKLPKYEIPHKFRYLPALPHNRNGKLDRALMKGLL